MDEIEKILRFKNVKAESEPSEQRLTRPGPGAKGNSKTKPPPTLALNDIINEAQKEIEKDADQRAPNSQLKEHAIDYKMDPLLLDEVVEG